MNAKSDGAMWETNFILAPVTYCRFQFGRIQLCEKQGHPSLLHVSVWFEGFLLLKRANVRRYILDLGVGQLVFVGRHLSLPGLGRSDELGV